MEKDSGKIDYKTVKIKQEKLSPPPKLKKEPDEILNEIIPTLFTNDSKTKSITAGVTSSDAISAETEDKKNIEPAKSSNEILAELFRVFNSTPPKTLLNDEYLLEQRDKKKQKKLKKHKKKSTKKGRSSSDDDDSNVSDEKTRKHKKKKKKKSKKKELSEKKELKIKREKLSPSGKLPNEFSDFTISDLDEIDKDNTISQDITTSIATVDKIKETKDKSPKSPPPETGKIVIKSLKDTNIFKEAEEKKARDKEEAQRRHRHRKEKRDTKRESESPLSLSDEETYLKEREEYRSNYDKNDNYHKEDEYRGGHHTRRDDYGRNSSRSRFRRSWRDGHDDRRSRSRSRKRSRSRELGIDKKRLLEIARKNAINMFKKGSLPGTQSLSQEIKDKVLLKMRYGGKTVEDLTDFCKKLSNGENLNEMSELSSDESDHDRNGNDKAFHHPFVLKDRGPIVMNIKNAVPIPPKSADQTKAILMQFPVSSGQQHRLNESEWIPVPPKRPEAAVKPLPIVLPPKPQTTKNVFAKPLPIDVQQPAFQPVPSPSTNSLAQPVIPVQNNPIPQPSIVPPVPVANNFLPLQAPPLPPELPPMSPVESGQSESIFPQTNQNIDVSAIISQRLNAMRRLQENPTDLEAQSIWYAAQKDMTAWANSKHLPGQFTGSTGVNILSAKELNSGIQAWAKKDQMKTSAPVSGGMGMHLLQKMGWKPGEGLGRERNGALQPLLLDVKLDKRGLVADEEDPSKRQIPPNKRRKGAINISTTGIGEDIELKHPVSLLGELASKRRWHLPEYELVEDQGPAHSRNFIFKVIVNGVIYQPSISSNTKKHAKATAAKYCLQQMGILPT